tara:strand:+ start:824 stop:2116 length:1293 start_codon:yes stop_codon:yes gene_type:complete
MPTNLNPISTTSAVVLTSTGSADKVGAAVPFGIYTGSNDFLNGAALQVNYVYKKLGGDVIDIELTPANVYSAYEEAVLEYSYIVNLHQSKNVLSDYMGNATGAFDHLGNIKSGSLSSSLGGTHVELKMPRMRFSIAKRIGEGLASLSGMGGTLRQYSASFSPATGQQDYDLQTIVETAADSGIDTAGNNVDFKDKIDNKRIIVTKVFYRSPRAMWRFYGYYGGIGVVGNGSTYGQFSDDSTFEVVPTWQNKLQAIMYEDSINTRTSNYSYEIVSNRLRLYPTPSDYSFGPSDRMFFRFYVDEDAWVENDQFKSGVNGINNMNTLPFANIPYANINSIGKQWIRKYALALCKEMLGQIRGKFTTVPIPGESVTLNHSELLSQAKEEQTELKDKLKEILKEMEYPELAKRDAEKAESATATLKNSPLPIFVG